jgi:FKBP-type peptidyl-prolyl cis-trans isomerase
MKRNWGWWLLALGFTTWGCGPPQVVEALLPGQVATRQVLPGEEAEALGEQASAGAVQPPTAVDASIVSLQPTKPGESDRTADNLEWTTVKAGSGEQAAAGKLVRVHYVGTLADGTKFDSSRDRNEAYSFRIGVDQVIRGWHLGVAGMRVGEVRKLVIPPLLAWGAKGFPPQIPPNSTVVFEIELLEVQ